MKEKNKTNKRSLATKILLPSLLPFMALLTLSTFASTTGILNLSGVIAPKTSINVTAQSAAATLDLEKSVNDLLVAIINEKSNVKAGYKVKVSSQNNGKLKGGDTSNSDAVVYTLKYDGSSVDLGSSQSTPVTVTHSNSKTKGDGVNKNVTISYQNPGHLTADTYSDTLIFTISSNN